MCKSGNYMQVIQVSFFLDFSNFLTKVNKNKNNFHVSGTKALLAVKNSKCPKVYTYCLKILHQKFSNNIRSILDIFYLIVVFLSYKLVLFYMQISRPRMHVLYIILSIISTRHSRNRPTKVCDLDDNWVASQ